MDFAGAIAMPLSIFAFTMVIYLGREISDLKKRLEVLEKGEKPNV